MGMNEDKKYKRICPECNKDVWHTNIKNKNHAEKIGKLCRSCGIKKNHADFNGSKNPFYQKKHSLKSRRKMSQTDRSYMSGKNHYAYTKSGWREKMKKALSGKNNPMYGKTGKLNPFFGKKHKKETILLLKEKCSGVNAGNYGKIFSDEHKNKIRLSHIKRAKRVGKFYKPNFNEKSCQYFDKMEKEKGWNGFYATKNGECFIEDLGYWLDYFEPNKNIVVEWDESRHYNSLGELNDVDKFRMDKIIKHLNCQFFRYSEIDNTLKEYKL